MPTCKRMTEMATDRGEGRLSFLARLAFDRHLAGCDGCRAYVRMLDATRLALARLPEPNISPALNEALMAQFDAWARTRPACPAPRPEPAWRFSPWPVLGTAAVLALLVAFAQARSQAPGDWTIGVALAAVALTVAALAGRLAGPAVAAATSAVVVAALAAGTGGETGAAAGVDCLVTELAAGAVVGGAAWFGARRGTRRALRGALAHGSVAGAIAAYAALQVTCAANDALAHLLAFHAAGVLVVAAGAAALLRVRPAAEPL